MVWLGVLMATAILVSGCGNEMEAKALKEGYGKPVNGLAIKLSGPENVEADGTFEVTVTIKNISDKPIEFAEGLMRPNFNILDANGNNIQFQLGINATQPKPPNNVTLPPNDTHNIVTRLDKTGVFIPTLHAGIKLTITATSGYEHPSEASLWAGGKLVSNPLTVSITDNTWGETVNGLHCYLRPAPETITAGEPMLLEMVIENADPTKPALLHATTDDKTKPQIDIEITDEAGKTVFKSQRSSAKSVDFITLNAGEKIQAAVIPTSSDMVQKVTMTGAQKAPAASSKMKLSALPSGSYKIIANYSHLVEKGKTYPKDWKKGWTGTIKSNSVSAYFIGAPTPPPPPPQPVSYIEIKPDKGKLTPLKKAKTVNDIKKALETLKPLKKTSKAKVKGTVRVVTDGVQTNYKYSSDYLEKEDEPGVQYQIPEVLKNQLPKSK